MFWNIRNCDVPSQGLVVSNPQGQIARKDETMTNPPETREERAAIVASLGLTVESVFVPFSQSRNKAEKYPSLNWRVTVLRNGREILTTDYSAGSAHCPSYKHDDKAETRHMVAWECEHGFKASGVRWGGRPEAYGATRGNVAQPIKPDSLNVLASLAMDSDVIDAGGFESWASDLGYDTDSRKAESIYRACLDIALKLRSALGDSGLQTLRNAFEGY